MRIPFFAILILTVNTSFAQKRIDFDKIRTELENSSESLNITLFTPDSDFYIGITKGAIVENPELNPCIDIVSDEKKNGEIIGILNMHSLLDKLYMKFESDYSDLTSDQVFKSAETELYLELLFKSNDFGVVCCFIPVFEKNIAKELISDLENLFDHSPCFEKLKHRI